MKYGDVVESAIWLTGEETREDRLRYEAEVKMAVDRLCEFKSVNCSPVVFIEKKPGGDRVPPVPDHVHGPDVRLLVGEAKVVGTRPVLETRSFLGELERQDLERLREIVRREYGDFNPGCRLTDLECDDVIEQAGPEAAMNAVRKAVDGGAMH